jgi:hypothetical protein
MNVSETQILDFLMDVLEELLGVSLRQFARILKSYEDLKHA